MFLDGIVHLLPGDMWLASHRSWLLLGIRPHLRCVHDDALDGVPIIICLLGLCIVRAWHAHSEHVTSVNAYWLVPRIRQALRPLRHLRLLDLSYLQDGLVIVLIFVPRCLGVFQIFIH